MRTRKTTLCIYRKNACLAQLLRDSERVKSVKSVIFWQLFWPWSRNTAGTMFPYCARNNNVFNCLQFLHRCTVGAQSFYPAYTNLILRRKKCIQQFNIKCSRWLYSGETWQLLVHISVIRSKFLLIRLYVGLVQLIWYHPPSLIYRDGCCNNDNSNGEGWEITMLNCCCWE